MPKRQTFGPYVLQLNPLELWEGRSLLVVPHRQLHVLATLLEAEGRTVSKRRLMEVVWQGLNVEQGNLTQTIFLLRKILGQMRGGR